MRFGGITKAGLSGLVLFGLVIAAMRPALAADMMVVEVTRAEARFDQRTGQPLVTFVMTDASKQQFAELTSRNVGRKMQVRLDGRVVMAPVIREPILGGSGQLTGFTAEEVRDVATHLTSGRAKLEFEIVAD